MPDNDEFTSSSGRFDREALMALVDARVRKGIEEWWDRYQLPLHNENLRTIKALTSAFDRQKGAMWIIGIIWIVVSAVIQIRK